jgi:hypothetical protein
MKKLSYLNTLCAQTTYFNYLATPGQVLMGQERTADSHQYQEYLELLNTAKSDSLS